jgi:hypothetical protein
MFDLNILAGLSIIIVSGIFVVWFFGKLTNTITGK